MKSVDIAVKRHSLAHILAMAVVELYPEARISTGPATETGFYYNIDFGDNKVGEENLQKIEEKMREIIARDLEFIRQDIDAAEAKELFKNNPYKLEIIDDKLAESTTLSTYKTGNDFTDLCSGPHIVNTSQLDPDAFKLTSVSGAYLKNDESRPMLTRIAGIAFDSMDELSKYLQMLEEAKLRDHRKIGREMDLFTFSPLVGSGLPMWTPRGTLLRNLIIKKIESIQERFGYQSVTIPHITKPELYQTSGHLEKFGEELFHVHGGKSGQNFVMKPMNCPHHTQIFASQARTYRDLPVRFSETTMVYRDEQAGELLGLSRVRSISQDDGHVFCSRDQLHQEIKNIIAVIREFYTSLGMWSDGKFWVSLSTRDDESMMGDASLWNLSEKVLEEIAVAENLPYQIVPGEAAFYGPKLDFQFTDALGRQWQLATVQLDFVMPSRFNLEFTNQNGEREIPVMIHRAIAGSLERFFSVIIEHFAGHFPLWLAPVQLVTIPVREDLHGEYARNLARDLAASGIRAEYAGHHGSFGKTVRHAREISRVPFVVIIGEQEVSSGNLTVETPSGKRSMTNTEILTEFENIQ